MKNLNSMIDVTKFFNAKDTANLSDAFNKAVYFIGDIRGVVVDQKKPVYLGSRYLPEIDLGDVKGIQLEGLVPGSTRSIYSQTLWFPFSEKLLEAEMNRVEDLCQRLQDENESFSVETEGDSVQFVLGSPNGVATRKEGETVEMSEEIKALSRQIAKEMAKDCLGRRHLSIRVPAM